MATACASLPGGREIGLAFGGLFTEAELAVADQLVQLSGSMGGGDEAAASGSESDSPRSVNTCTAAAAWVEGEEMVVVAGLGLGTTMELDRRARKRYRLLSDVYAATRPVTAAVAGAGDGKSRKRKRVHEPEAGTTTIRYDGDRCF